MTSIRRWTGLPMLHDDSSEASQELFLDVLSSAATKREAKSYLSRFRSEKPKKNQLRSPNTQSPDVGVNLGNLYVPVRSIDQSPLFIQGQGQTQFASEVSDLLHVALIKIRVPQAISDPVLQSVALTLVQLKLLGMSSVVVIDCDCIHGDQEQDPSLRQLAIEQADRVAAAIERHGPGARRLDNVLEVSKASEGLRSDTRIRIASRELLLTPLRNGKIPVIASIAFATENQTLVRLPADEAVLALTRDFAGLRPRVSSDAEPQAIAQDIATMQKEISLDRIILLDPLGGIPSFDKQHKSHVFINLEQEYEAIKSELSRLNPNDLGEFSQANQPGPKDEATQAFIYSNPVSALWNKQVGFGNGEQPANISPSDDGQGFSTDNLIHVSNLGLLRDTLAMLPPSSSGLLTTPEIAANVNHLFHNATSLPGVGTRRQRNPLIYNLLTDKPFFSSSLPSDRTQQPTIIPATFIKRGMPVSIIPDPRIQPWTHPSSIRLSDPCIDLPRLVHLIEDSFDRRLDLAHYLARIEDRIAGIIVAGEYEGGAILTWEPSGRNLDFMVPYLDKFAVLKRSQGGGVADIVFKAMVRSCLPGGVCWRSRMDNPVNKWYFERARGTWKIPGSNWTMFWTTDGVQIGADGGVFKDYESVCRGVQPSWADQKGVID
ncbi:MAG: hypothetical protein Q9170_005658 [Blastenia crenularia]